MDDAHCITRRCRLTAYWSRQPKLVQNLTILAGGLLIASALVSLGHALGLGETQWIWHIP